MGTGRHGRAAMRAAQAAARGRARTAARHAGPRPGPAVIVADGAGKGPVPRRVLVGRCPSVGRRGAAPAGR